MQGLGALSIGAIHQVEAHIMDKSALCEKLRTKIKASKLWGQRSRETAKHLSGLRCPECGHYEASAYIDFPAVILCSRKNQCGVKTKTLDLFPELRENFTKTYPPTRDDPNRPAREYLFSRGLTSKSIEGLQFEFWRNIRKSGADGVMFFVGTNSAGEKVWNGRLFSPPQGVSKTHNQGLTGGLLWKHPAKAYHADMPTFVGESVIEALSLWEMGLQAVAVLSATQSPPEDLGEIAPNLVIALNPDEAGQMGLRKWREAYPKAKAITPVCGDWNDFLLAHGPGASTAFERDRSEMECRANLLLCGTARDYADTWFAHYGYPPGLFAFERKYFWSVFGKKELEVRNVSDFVLETDHFQLDTSSPDNPVYRYFLQIRPANGKPVVCSMAGQDLASPNAIRSALLTSARVMWKGDQGPSIALASKIVDCGAPVVRQVHVLGHDRESECLVFRDFAVDREGKVHEPGQRGFFRISRQEILRPLAIGSERDRTLKPKKGEKIKRIYELINQAWPDNGPLALAFTVGSWFVWRVKPELGFFPFLSLFGDTQTGKSHLVRRLNAMQCLDSEGLPMTKLNTGKGEIRDLAKKSGLMIPLLEGNKEERMRFDLESLLTLYNAGNPLQVRAMKTNDLATKVTEFLGTLCFVQNREPFRTKPQLERVVSSRKFSSDDINSDSYFAFKELLKIPLREMGQCYIEVMSRRKEVEKSWYREYLKARNEIIEHVPDNRIAENHAVVLGFHHIVENIFDVKNDLTSFLVGLAKKKHRKCTHREATEADSFFEALDGLSESTAAEVIHVDGNKGRVFVRFTEALKKLDGVGYKFYRAPLMESLREHPGFLASNIGHWASWTYMEGTGTRNCKCWCFDAAKLDSEMCEILGE